MNLYQKGIIALIILLITIVACVHYFSADKIADDSHLRMPFTQQEQAMVNTALNDDIIQSLLNNHTYDISEVNVSGRYVLIDVGKNEPRWSCLIVGIDPVNNTKTYAYNLVYYFPGMSHDDDPAPELVKIAVNNQSVIDFLGNRVLYVRADQIYSNPFLIFNLGNVTNISSAEVFPGPAGGLYVGVDIENDTIKNIEYSPPYNQAILTERMITNGVYNTTIVKRHTVFNLIHEYRYRKAAGLNDSQIVSDFATSGIIYNPVTGNLTIEPQYSFYNMTGPLTFSTSGEYLFAEGVVANGSTKT